MFESPTRSILPLDVAHAVAPGTIVRLVVGQQDEVTPPADSQAYAAALRQHGIDVSVDVVPALGHNILFAPRVLDAVGEVLSSGPSSPDPEGSDHPSSASDGRAAPGSTPQEPR